MSEEVEGLSDLVGHIYDAALDRTLWPGVLTTLSEFVGGIGAALYSKDAVGYQGHVHHYVGIEPYFKQLYFKEYIKIDPTSAGQVSAAIDQPVAVADLMPYGVFAATQFYHEWVQPQRLVDFVATVVDRSATSGAIFGVFRHERDGVTDNDARYRMRLTAPHIRRATLIGRMFDLKSAEVATFSETLDGFGAGIFLLDAGGRIVHANASGHGILSASEVLRVVGGRLVASDAQTDQTLREIFALAGQGDAELGTRGIAVPLTSLSGERWLAHLLPLTSGMRRKAGKAYSAVAALFVRKASLEIPSSVETMSKLYRLTPSEVRVLGTLSEVGGVPSAAGMLGISEATVRTHLHHLFAKTRTNRQTDLVKLVAAHANPLVRS